MGGVERVPDEDTLGVVRAGGLDGRGPGLVVAIRRVGAGESVSPEGTASAACPPSIVAIAFCRSVTVGKPCRP